MSSSLKQYSLLSPPIFRCVTVKFLIVEQNTVESKLQENTIDFLHGDKCLRTTLLSLLIKFIISIHLLSSGNLGPFLSWALGNLSLKAVQFNSSAGNWKGINIWEGNILPISPLHTCQPVGLLSRFASTKFYFSNLLKWKLREN